MRRLLVLGAFALTSFVLYLAPAGAGAAMFGQCPAIENDSGCQFLFTVTDSETTIETDPSQGPYDPGGDDALIGIVNKSSKPVSSIPISAEIELFGFEGDGICAMTKRPAGCVILEKGPTKTENVNHGRPCEVAFLEHESCGFPSPKGEPKEVRFPEGITVVGYDGGEKEDAVTGYEGPTSWFSGIGSQGFFHTGKGVVNFSPALAPGEATYFSLESPPTGGFGATTSLSTTLSGGGQSGAAITALQGAPVTDTATLSGANAPAATGTVTFAVYSDSECKKLVTAAGSAKLAGGKAGPSAAETLAPGKYYWQAHYAGNTENQAVTSACSSETLTVLAPTTTTTAQSGGGISAPSLTAPVGTPVTDTATIAGPLAAVAGGAVSYVLYKDSKCTVPALPGSSAAVTKGLALPSAPVKPGVGTYYWLASYSGDAVNAPSASACGAEVLKVAKKLPLGLRAIRGCVSKRHFIIHPKAPRGVKLVKVEELINGVRVFTARLTRRHTTVDLRGFPKGTYKVELIATDSRGRIYEDTRTFKTCVKRHKHKKHK